MDAAGRQNQESSRDSRRAALPETTRVAAQKGGSFYAGSSVLHSEVRPAFAAKETVYPRRGQ